MKTLKDMPEHSRQREKLQERGASAPTDEELERVNGIVLCFAFAPMGCRAGQTPPIHLHHPETALSEVRLRRSKMFSLPAQLEAGSDSQPGRVLLGKPTKPMRDEAVDAGRYESKLWHDKDYPKIQILTIEGLLNKTERVDAPPQMNPFAKAQREAKPGKQADLI